jgi:hemoglobin
VTSLYEHAGADEGLHRLEEIFYSKVLADLVLKSLFTERRPHHVEHLTWFTAESFGGPDRFTRELGFQHIIDVHRHLKITDKQQERFVTLYMEALDEAGLPNDEPFRQAVHSHVDAEMLHDYGHFLEEQISSFYWFPSTDPFAPTICAAISASIPAPEPRSSTRSPGASRPCGV